MPTEPGRVLAGLRVVMVEPLYPGNVGAAARAMRNSGISRLVLVAPPALDLERARWMAPGATGILDGARFVPGVADAVSGCTLAVGCTARLRRWDWPVWTPAEMAGRVMDQEGPVAILFGREDTGLDNRALSRCQAAVSIPTAGLASLNLSHAVAVIGAFLLDEAIRRGYRPPDDRRQGRRSGGGGFERTPAPRTPAPLDEQWTVVAEALDLLSLTPYLRGRSRQRLSVFLGNLLQRSQPTRRELSVLRGMLHKTAWRIEHGAEE